MNSMVAIIAPLEPVKAINLTMVGICDIESIVVVIMATDHR